MGLQHIIANARASTASTTKPAPAQPASRRVPRWARAGRPDPTPDSGRWRRAAAGLAIIAFLPFTMAASCDTGEEQEEEEQQQEQEEDGGQEEED